MLHSQPHYTVDPLCIVNAFLALRGHRKSIGNLITITAELKNELEQAIEQPRVLAFNTASITH